MKLRHLPKRLPEWARELARLFAASPLPSESLQRQFKIVGQSCTDCHRAFRDRPKPANSP